MRNYPITDAIEITAFVVEKLRGDYGLSFAALPATDRDYVVAFIHDYIADIKVTATDVEWHAATIAFRIANEIREWHGRKEILPDGTK